MDIHKWELPIPKLFWHRIKAKDLGYETLPRMMQNEERNRDAVLDTAEV
jgi:hypothetical protein